MKQRNLDFLTRETKKEYIIRLAKEDPFLKIEEIAEYAGTTQRYVRTILSEANLSLMNMREAYARKMEKNSESKVLLSVKDSLHDLRLHTRAASKIFTYGLPQAQMIEDSDNFDWNINKAQLFGYTQHMYYGGKLFGLIEMILYTELPGRKLGQKIPLFSLLGFTPDEVKLSSPEIEGGMLEDLLEVGSVPAEFVPELPVIKVNTFLHANDQVLGKEIFYFPAEYVKLTIPGYFSSTLELTRES